jgi:hypothetical protein
MIRSLLLIFLLVSSATAEEPRLPREVVGVTTLGYWQTASQSGTYRVVVTQNGWEHVWSQVFVQWLPEPKSRDAAEPPITVAELLPPVAQGAFVLEASSKHGRKNEILVTIQATSNMEPQAKPLRFVFSAREPGVIKLLPSARQ